MPYVASIGLYFVPVLCLLGAGWSYVRWKNEEDEALSQRARNKKQRKALLFICCCRIFRIPDSLPSAPRHSAPGRRR